MRWVATFTVLWTVLTSVAGGCCNNDCSGRGKCTIVGSGCICQCFAGFAGADCSRRACPVGKSWSSFAAATDVAHLPDVCSNRGVCDESSGVCQCDPGFTGAACDRLACPLGCSNRGECRSIKFQATQKDKGMPPPVVYTANWDSDMVYGCLCHDGFYGADCSQRRCPTGDDPLTGFTGDPIFGQQFNEKQSVSCSSTGGSFTLSFRGQTTVPINSNDPVDAMTSKLQAISTITQVLVLFSSTATTACPPGGNVIVVEFVQDFGPLPLLVGNPNNLVYTNVGGSVALTVARLQVGNKENLPCSNRGTCDVTSGICACYDGYTTSDGKGGWGIRGDCGGVLGSITACPGVVTCSGHGYCTGSPQYACVCFGGWTSGDCSVRTCPQGPAWFDMAVQSNDAHRYAICSNAGVCDSATGVCNCAPGFEGSACQRMRCPGVGDPPCSGRGQCLTQERLALLTTANGDPTPLVYGSIPNNPATWDFNKIQGCVCDKGYGGHDCSQRVCPTGDNPRTTGQSNEVQTITCTAITASTFQLRFRGATTVPISTAATTAQMASALLPVTGFVRVTYASGVVACKASGPANVITVAFVTELGDLPAMQVTGVDATKISSFVINTDGVAGSVQGTTENIECAGSGLCDRAKGVCLCFSEYSSSDSANAPGIREDCGSIRQQPLYS
ncbi:hypothetical protein H257_18409 [Aphanomyces astaci]|uniref:EGF-like domain-containing protein n=1 Tax=Aphanomyces astaci TaxID=112090 RepID=W4FCZ9_APHAT|nr:hypothetical protein H257_18409 [Aphanomyces astaci]ETV64774.1 hypothetical protein H257_18409 [Aphanomyces astaci]|eukprot:XP_009845758.1 hypothetical protein H257_18409 [Aphanomyces astaci]